MHITRIYHYNNSKNNLKNKCESYTFGKKISQIFEAVYKKT